MTERLGKIKSVKFGAIDGRLGLHFDLGGDGWGVGDFWGTWENRPKTAKYTEAEHLAELGKLAIDTRNLLSAAKVGFIHELVGKPIRVTFNRTTLEGWSVLTEVL